VSGSESETQQKEPPHGGAPAIRREPHLGVPFRADLGQANLSEATLLGADLVGARLIRANLSHATLSEANLT
jgi:hypothetical protein